MTVTTNENKKSEVQQLDLELLDLSAMDNRKMAPILPQFEEQSDDEDEYDLQKELEAKFDELFGPLDEE